MWCAGVLWTTAAGGDVPIGKSVDGLLFIRGILQGSVAQERGGAAQGWGILDDSTPGSRKGGPSAGSS